MTPKSKANELVEKMAVYHWTDICDYEGAKQCALIAVETVILNCYEEEEYYWQEVKQEIEKL
jgi:hypothetical protein